MPIQGHIKKIMVLFESQASRQKYSSMESTIFIYRKNGGLQILSRHTCSSLSKKSIISASKVKRRTA